MSMSQLLTTLQDILTMTTDVDKVISVRPFISKINATLVGK